MRVTATIITKNEEENIKKCIESLKWCNEVVVIDSMSTDQTVAIAESLGAKVFQHKFVRFGTQKRYATEKASNDWILSVDADEVVSPKLAEEIKNVLIFNDKFYYQIRIQNFFLGKSLNFWFSKGQWHIRLFNRQFANFNEAKVHEKVTVNGEWGLLNNPLLHESYKSLSHYIEKLNFYTDLSSHEAPKHFVGAYILPFRFIYTFFNILLIKGAIRSSYRGVIWSLLSAFYTFIKHLKKYEKVLTTRLK